MKVKKSRPHSPGQVTPTAVVLLNILLILISYFFPLIRHIASLFFHLLIFSQNAFTVFCLSGDLMLTFIELLIGVVVIVGVARYIIKGYSATGVLFVGGLTLLIISALMGHKVLPASATSTGYNATDIVEYIKILLMSRGGDLGMMIMMLCGFAAYMTHIGANDMVVKLASKPLRYINSPYVLMIAAYFVACLMSLAVSSATGLGVLLMATLFPVMVNVGISRGAAAAICASPAAIILSPPPVMWCWQPKRRKCR